jgi:hypothetical protein
VRIFVHNGQARLLRRFQPVLQHPAVRVILFEGNDELATALNLLNALDASVVLDLPHLCRTPEGAAQASQALRRFLTDPLWRIQLNPFAPMLRAALEGVATPWVDRWGLPPAAFECIFGEGLSGRAAGYASEVIRELAGEQQRGAAYWLDEHRACADCQLRSICGGQLSAAGGRVCSKDELAVVDRVRDEARQLVARLANQTGEA